jgi:hypothetical protein
MNWLIQAYATDTGGYFVTRRGPNDWLVLDPSSTIHDGFTNQNAAMAFAESLNLANALPPSVQVSPTN